MSQYIKSRCSQKRATTFHHYYVRNRYPTIISLISSLSLQTIRITFFPVLLIPITWYQEVFSVRVTLFPVPYEASPRPFSCVCIPDSLPEFRLYAFRNTAFGILLRRLGEHRRIASYKLVGDPLSSSNTLAFLPSSLPDAQHGISVRGHYALPCGWLYILYALLL